jgi:glycosyltransferase involved in cell wall biosynthesis
MRIIYLHQYFSTLRMAGGNRSYEMARRLVAAGHEVHMVTTWREPLHDAKWFETDEAGIRVHWLPVPYSNHMGFAERITAFARFARASAVKAASLPGDVVLATSTPLTIAMPGVYSARRKRIPMVFEVRDLWPEVPVAIGVLKNPVLIFAARRLERFAYGNASRIVALSPGIADGVAAAGVSRHRIRVIPNAADLDLFAPDDQSAARFRMTHPELGRGPIMLYPGALGRVNGVAYLARLAAAVRHERPDLRFVIIGDGMEWSFVERKARELGVLGVSFFMYPEVSKKDIVAAFNAASMIVSVFINVPQLQANSANKFFDALASGTAVAINYEGWQADLLRETGAGIVLPADPDMAADPLIRYFADGRVEQAGMSGRKLAEARFSRDKLTRELELMLVEAVSQSAEH